MFLRYTIKDSGVNLSDIEQMLQNVNSYGLSHLCAFSIFELAEESIGGLSFSYPFLDIYFKNDRPNSKHDVEFYSRGFKYNKKGFNNLFEYLIFTEQHGFWDWKTHPSSLWISSVSTEARKLFTFIRYLFNLIQFRRWFSDVPQSVIWDWRI